MRVTILGSGTNLHPSRAAAGYLVKTDHLFLMDFGPRTLSNLLKTRVDRHQIQYLLFTHYHADHFSDFITFFFDAVCHSKFVLPRANLTIIGPKGTSALFGSILRTFPSFKDYAFKVTFKEVCTRSFTIGDTRVTPVPVTHTPRQICLGYRIRYQGRTLAYSGDATYAPNLLRLCRTVDLAILDCSFPQNCPGESHMHAGECGRVAQEAGVKRLVLSHFYPIADRFDVKKQAAQVFGGKIIRARDRLTLSV
jgi:ribonuclease BN (tRNA processing enzyme)